MSDPMLMKFRWIKAASGALDPGFISDLARHFGLRAFVETGTFLGDTLASLSPLFDRLISIEIKPELAARARVRFKNEKKVTIVEGDSAQGLRDALTALGEEPALVWLDAHYSGGDTGRGARNTPILDEVGLIVERANPGHVVLVDDLRYFWPTPPGFMTHEALAGYPSAGQVASRLNEGAARYDCFALGDALLAIPASQRHRYEVSQILAACTRSRLLDRSARLEAEFESIIGGAQGDERAAIADLPEFIVSQSDYGLGGHYFYWRSLLSSPDAERDRRLAVSCRVIPS
jgi:hypothetical protein